MYTYNEETDKWIEEAEAEFIKAVELVSEYKQIVRKVKLYNKTCLSLSKKLHRKPTIEEIYAYSQELGLSTYDYNGQQKSQAQTTAESFFDYYSANGWKVGKNPMKDWKASLRNWIRKDGQFNKQRGGGRGTFSDEQTDALITMFTGSANN
jgi:hypothetical protein